MRKLGGPESSGTYVSLFWRQVILNPNSTLSSGNTLVDLPGTIQLDRLLKEDPILLFVRSLLIGLQCEPVKALLAHSLYNLIIHWCNLNEPQALAFKRSEPYGKRAWETFLPTQSMLLNIQMSWRIKKKKKDDLCNEVLSSVRNTPR